MNGFKQWKRRNKEKFEIIHENRLAGPYPGWLIDQQRKIDASMGHHNSELRIIVGHKARYARRAKWLPIKLKFEYNTSLPGRMCLVKPFLERVFDRLHNDISRCLTCYQMTDGLNDLCVMCRQHSSKTPCTNCGRIIGWMRNGKHIACVRSPARVLDVNWF